MSREIKVSFNKSLKLTNVLIAELPLKEISQGDSFPLLVRQMENYIKQKGFMPIGPLIQKTSYSINEEGQIDVQLFFMRQSNNFIHNVEEPYKMESLIRVRNCMYARYIGPEEKLKFAYDKINVTAFEEDVELSNENYTIFVDQQDENIVADVFVEKKSNE